MAGKGNSSATAIRAREAAAFADTILSDPEYRKNLKARACAGMLSPGTENMLWYYRYGKPVERVEITDMGKADLTEMTTEELAARAAAISVALQQEHAEEERRRLEAAVAAMDAAGQETSMIREPGDPIDVVH